MTRFCAAMISAVDNFLTFFLTRKPSDLQLLGRDRSAPDFPNFLFRTKTILSDDDVALVAVSLVTKAFAEVNVAVQFFPANFSAADSGSAFDVFLCFSARTFPEKHPLKFVLIHDTLELHS